MLNCFFGYAFIWIFILILYACGFSQFNNHLDFGLVLFIISTIVISLILGFYNKNKFKYQSYAKNPGRLPILIISIGFILNFIYARSIPFLNIVKGSAGYGDFEGIPLVYVFIVGISYYYGINYFNAFLNLENNKKQNLLYFIIINIFYLLCFSRSMILFLLGGAFILYMQKRRYDSKHLFKKKKVKIITIIFVMFVALYSFGALGNIRSGYKFNDNSYIERIGLYNNSFPKFLPKQFMWSYSYLTTPLANLNYNVVKYKKNNNNSFNYRGVTSELINRTFSKRLFPDLFHNMTEEDFGFDLIRTYFNAATGYCMMFRYGGYIGIWLEYIVLIIITLIQLSLLKKDYNKDKANGTFIILFIVNTLMFFYNTLNTTTMAWWMLVNFVALLPKIKIKWR